MGILKKIAAIPDRIISYCTFGVCGLTGMQVPKYLDSLEHEFRGALTEATRNVESWRPVADTITGGHTPADLGGLVTTLHDAVVPHFAASSDAVTSHTAQVITDALGRYSSYDGAVNALEHASWVGPKIHAAVTHYDPDLVRQTWEHFIPGLDFSTDAALSAAVVGFAGLGIYYIAKKSVKGIYHKARGTAPTTA